MPTENRAEVMDFIERFNFNLGNAIECIARATANPDRASLLNLKKLIGIWSAKSEGSNKTTRKPSGRLNLLLPDLFHRYINSTKVNRTAPYGKTGWVTNIDSTMAHGNIRPRAKTIGNQYVSTKFSPTSAHTHQW